MKSFGQYLINKNNYNIIEGCSVFDSAEFDHINFFNELFDIILPKVTVEE